MCNTTSSVQFTQFLICLPESYNPTTQSCRTKGAAEVLGDASSLPVLLQGSGPAEEQETLSSLDTGRVLQPKTESTKKYLAELRVDVLQFLISINTALGSCAADTPLALLVDSVGVRCKIMDIYSAVIVSRMASWKDVDNGKKW
jgi:hypothetical protein